MQIERHCLKMSKVAERWVAPFAWFPILSSSPVWCFQKQSGQERTKAGPPSVCINSSPSLTSRATCLLTTDTSALALLPLTKSRWKMRMLSYCKSKRNIIHKRRNPCSAFVSHPFTTLDFIYRKVIPVSIWKYPFFFCGWTLSAHLLLVWHSSGEGAAFASCCTWCSCPCSYWGCRASFCSHLHIWNPTGSTGIVPGLLKAVF